jgi:hypothetical protein
MKRKLAIVLAALIVIATGFAAMMYFRMRSKMRGPPPPECHLAALARKTFEPPKQVSFASKGAYHLEPSAALTGAGELVAVYNARTTLFGDSWLEAVKLGADGKTSTAELKWDKTQYFDTWVANGGDGVLRAVWLGHNGGLPEREMEVGYSESTDGAHWSAPRPVHDEKQDCPNGARGCMDKPMIAATGAQVRVFYFSEPGGGLRMVQSLDGGKHFSPSVGVPNAGAYADVAFALSGKMFVVSMSGREEGETDRYGDARGDIELSVDLGQPSRVSAAGDVVPFFFSNPQVEVDEARGFVYVVYPAGAEHRWDVWLATSKDGGQTFTRVKVNDDASCASHMAPQAALDPATGTLHVTWLENRSGKGGLAYAACESGGAKCGANEAVSGEFASFGYGRHQTDWLAEYGTLFVDVERRLLHSVWTQSVDEGGKPMSRIFHAQARLP